MKDDIFLLWRLFYFLFFCFFFCFLTRPTTRKKRKRTTHNWVDACYFSHNDIKSHKINQKKKRRYTRKRERGLRGSSDPHLVAVSQTAADADGAGRQPVRRPSHKKKPKKKPKKKRAPPQKKTNPPKQATQRERKEKEIQTIKKPPPPADNVIVDVTADGCNEKKTKKKRWSPSSPPQRWSPSSPPTPLTRDEDTPTEKEQ